MDRTICTQDGPLQLLYAEESDRPLIYQMATEDPELFKLMSSPQSDFTYDHIKNEEPHFFGPHPGLSKYLLISLHGHIIGVISHTYHDAKIKNMELDVWLRSSAYTNKGTGAHALKTLINHLHSSYGVKTFLIRPWIQNVRALRAYEKCGFAIKENFDITNYYSKYLQEYGDGDFGPQTANMVLQL